jgi:nitrate reductase molybdenum cofactor assembly chaperone NarJ/NarW
MKVLPRRERTAVNADTETTTRLVLKAASLVLAYPDEELLGRLSTIEHALAGTTAQPQFAPVLHHLRQGPTTTPTGPLTHLARLQAFHVAEFDLSRKHALHLSYWTDGDTRRRGAALVDVQSTYRESGLEVDPAGELPDYLPLVLEFAAAAPEAGLALLQRFRASLELIRLGLVADALPHAGVLEAVCDLLPGEAAHSLAEVQARFGEAQPIEFVGLSESARA